ncbi:MAG: hypothetical protein AAB538_02470, partial [Patescibacteria group bacterium]
VTVDGSLWCADLDIDRLGNLQNDQRYDLSELEKYGPDTSLWIWDYWRDDRRVTLASCRETEVYQDQAPDTGAQDIERGNTELGNLRIIRNEQKNPLWAGRKPYIRTVDYPLERKFFGLSTAEILEAQQFELNAFRNLRMDHSMQILQPVTLVGRRARMEGQFKRYPGSIMNVLDINEIRELPAQDIKNAGIVEVADIYRDIQKTVGSNEAVEGGNINPSRTAGTTLQQVDQLGSVRIAFKSMMLANSFFTALSTWHRQLNRQFMPDEQAFAIGGQMARTWLTVPPEVWNQEWDAYPVVVGADSTTPQAKTAQILGFVNSIQPILQSAQLLQGQGIKARKILEQIMQHYQGLFDNPAEVMMSQQEWDQSQANEQRQQMLQAMAGRQAAPGQGQPQFRQPAGV